MRRLKEFIGLIIILGTSAPFTGCAPHLYQPFNNSEARLGTETAQYETLKSLPEPKEKIVAAVYKFRDQTGQYKPSEFFQNFSTAITQGATSILLRALEESNWFVAIERENLNNLLNERKIIRSSRAQYSMENGKNKDELLPPLLFAGIILEGGIISYDANVITGGAGLRYFGAGASGQYREDKITVYLRAISTSNGRILKTVYTSKTILSQMIDVGLFRYVKFKRLLEVETGYTHNEPTQMAVTEAIEKAVESLIIEGVLENLWGLADSTQLGGLAMTNYTEEKEKNEKTDSFGRYMKDRRKKFRAGLNVGGILYDGDYVKGEIKEVGEFSFGYNASPAITISTKFGRGTLATEDFYNKAYYYGDLVGTFRFLPKYRFTPSLLLGMGMMIEEGKQSEDFTGNLFPKFLIGVDFEYMLSEKWGLNMTFVNNYLSNDRIDGLEHGQYNDTFWKSTLGINYYFGSKLQ